jgi:hypothetical protein
MSHRRRVPLVAALALGLVTLPSRALPATDDPAPASGPTEVEEPAASRSEGRELGGHTFMPALGLVEPFATTNFGTFLTVGSGTTTGSLTLQLPGNPPPPPQTFTGKVSYAAVGGVLGYEYEFLRGVSGRFLLSETLYSGTTGAAMAVVGSNARFGLDLGVTAGTVIGDSVRVAGVIDASSAPRIGMLLGKAIKTAYGSCSTDLANCVFDFGQLIQQENVVEVRPGVAASWAPMRSLGVTGNVSYAWRRIAIKDGGTTTESGISFGAAADFDFMKVSKVPLGLQLTWASRVPVSSDTSDRFTDVGGGIFYTGRKDLSLGVQVVDRRFKVVPEVKVSWSTVMALTGLRYYW